MNIVITMAGAGSRFQAAGYNVPKHEIVIGGRSLLEWSLISLKNFFNHHFILVGRKDAWNIREVKKCCASLGISKLDCIELPELTGGQADTVMKALPAIPSRSDALLIFNIDTFVEPEFLHPRDIRGSGWIPVFEALGDKWSFCTMDKNSKVCAVAEKKRISEFATVGLYYFESFSRFEECLGAYDYSGYREHFVAPLYNVLLQSGKDVYGHLVPAKAVHVLGTPEDLKEFHPEIISL